MNGRKLTLIGLLTLAGLALVAVLVVQPAGATITGDAPPGFGDWTINNPTTIIDETVYVWDGNITINSKLSVQNSTVNTLVWARMDYYDIRVNAGGSLQTNDSHYEGWNGMFGFYQDFYIDGSATIENCTIDYTREFNVTGSLDMDNTYLTYIESPVNLMGDVMINGSTFYGTQQGVFIDEDNVVIQNSHFTSMYNKGLYFDDCEATLDDVTITVTGGSYLVTYTTDQVFTGANPYQMAIGMGIWVEGGNPTFMDVDVRAYQQATFKFEYTGTDSDVETYMEGLAATVLINSADVDIVEGIYAHDSNFPIRAEFWATDPGQNPLYFYGNFEGMSSGIAIINYDDVEVTDVDVMSVQYYTISLSVSGAYYGYGYSYSYGPRMKVTSAVIGPYDPTMAYSITLRDMSLDNADMFYTHMFSPSWAGAGVPTFKNSIMIENIDTTYSGYEPVFYILATSAYDGVRNMEIDLEVTQCTFMGLNGPMLYYYLEAGPGIDTTMKVVDVMEDISVNNCTFKECWYDDAFIIVDSVWTNHMSDRWVRTVTIADNEFRDFWGVCFDVYGVEGFVKGRESLYVLNNDFLNITDGDYGWSGPFYAESFDTILFKGNTLTDMHYKETGDFNDEGGDDNGAKPDDWVFRDNTVKNCTNERWSEIIFLGFGGAVSVINNDISECNGFMSIYHVTDFSGKASFTATDNEYYNNRAYLVETGNTDEGNKLFTMTLQDNTVYGNEDFFINYWGNSNNLNLLNNDGTFIIENNTFHDNTGGIIHAWGNVAIWNNAFDDNAGPLAKIDYINLNIPKVSGNSYANNVDLFQFIGKDLGFQLVAMVMTNQMFPCTGIAMSFTNMEVTFNAVGITGAATSIQARNTFVDLYSCEIDGTTCEVIGDGLITAWWPMEVYVTWGDMHGLDSTVPTGGALVVFYNAMEVYYSSSYADDGGLIAEEIYTEWFMDVGGISMQSPYTVKVAAAGATNEVEVTLDKELVGVDMVHIIIWDTFEPVVAITDPFMGAMYGMDAVNVLGFVAEVGSGLAELKYSDDDGANWYDLTPDGSGDWLKLLGPFVDGDMTVQVSAKDIAGNTNTTSVTFTIDTIPPSLSVVAPSETTNMEDITLTGTIEPQAEVYVNGLFLWTAPGSNLDIPWKLHEGVNVIVVEAMDDAGNSAIETVTVTLDTHDPILVVNGPADGIVTNIDSVEVTGYVEVGTTLTVDGTQVMPGLDGFFSYEVDLPDGDQMIVISATDDAGNTATLNRMVTLDQDAPNVEIKSPKEADTVSSSIISVHIVADVDATLVLNGRRLPTSGDIVTTILLLEGENLITLRGTDSAGNVAIEEVMVTLDTRPPSLGIDVPGTLEVWTNANNYLLSGSSSEAAGVTVNGIPASTFNSETGAWGYTLPLDEIGEIPVYIVATDAAGNEVTLTRTFYVSRTLPTLNVDEVPSEIKTSSVTISGSTDPGIKMVSVKVGEVTSSYNVDYDGEFAFTLTLVDAVYDSLEVSVMDRYGNVKPMNTNTFTVKAKDVIVEEPDEGPTLQPMELGLLLAVIGITIIVVAFLTVYAFTRRRDQP